MPFKYRLEKVLKYRIQKKEEQVQEVIKAQNEVDRIEAEIRKNKEMILTLRRNLRAAPHSLMENYDVYIKHINEVIVQLEEEKQQAIEKLQEEQEKLKELEKAVNVVEKHKEKAFEQYKEEEKKAEMKKLDEVAGQKYFAKMRSKIEEELADELAEEERQLLNEN